VTPFEEILERYRTKCEDWGNMGRDAVLDQLTELEDALLAHVAQLEADRDRLEWLEALPDLVTIGRPYGGGFSLMFRGPREAGSGPTLREAIDAARAKGEGQ
jgi:uncharacterized protein YciI